MNTNYTIPAFAEPITSLPDTPTCAAAELKRRFQAPADEVREAHNALAEAHETLDEKVEGIVTETFAGAIHESMFDEELAEKFNGKADQTALSAEVQAREELAADNTKKHAQLSAQITTKCEIVTGSYIGSGKSTTKTISLGFTPKAVLVASLRWTGNYANPQKMNLAVTGVDSENVSIVSNGFQVKQYCNLSPDESQDDCPYRYIAFK